MKKYILILLTLVPILAGWLINVTLLVPVLGELMFYVFPILVLVFWFRLGSRYAETDWAAFPAILIGNATGLLSVIIYLWQFAGLDEASRNVSLAVWSQMYSAGTLGYFWGGVVTLFFRSRAASYAMQVVCLASMIVVFSLGFFRNRESGAESK